VPFVISAIGDMIALWLGAGHALERYGGPVALGPEIDAGTVAELRLRRQIDG
jgi:hypothetical protein